MLDMEILWNEYAAGLREEHPESIKCEE